MVDSNRALRDGKLALTLDPLPRGEGDHLVVLVACKKSSQAASMFDYCSAEKKSLKEARRI